MNSLKKALAILLSAMTVFTSLPISAISAFAAETSDTVVCYNCKGNGYTSCVTCNGQGVVQQKCTACVNGKIEANCEVCGGDGLVKDEQEVESPCTNENCVEGKVVYDCTNCNGTGMATVDCPDCEDGHVSCDVCKGTGEITLVEDENFKFVNQSISDAYSVVYEEGKSFSMKAESADQNGRAVTYTSSDTKVATIDENGTVSILNAGNTEIAATIAADNKTYKETTIKCALTIEKAEQQFELIAPANDLVCGETFPLVAVSNSAELGNMEFSIDSDSEKYINLDNETKIITAKNATPEGTAVSVTAVLPENENYKETKKIITFRIAKADINNLAFEIAYPQDIVVGSNLDNAVTFSGADAKYEIVDGNQYATISGSTLQAVQPGTVTVKATVSGVNYNEASAEYTVNIVSAEDSSQIKFSNSANPTIPYGSEYSNPVINVPEGVEVEYESLDNMIATVDENGKITTVKPGQVTIRATAGEASLTYSLTIEKADQNLQFKNSKLVVGYGEETDFSVTGAGNDTVTSYSVDSDSASINESGILAVSKLNSDNEAIVVTATNEGNEYYNAAEISCQIVISKKVISDIGFNEIGLNRKVPYSTAAYELEFNKDLPEGTTYSIKITQGEDCAQIVDGNQVKAIKPGNVTVLCTFSSDLYDISPIEYGFEIVKADQQLTFDKEKVDILYGQSYSQKAALTVGTDNEIIYSVKNDANGIIKTIDENTGDITFNDGKTGAATITATVDGDDNYNEASASYTIEVKFAESPEVPYTITPSLAEGIEWYGSNVDPVKIIAPQGYQISESNSLGSNNAWNDSISFTDDGVYDDIAIYLKNTDNGGITDAVKVETIKIDRTAPAVPAAFEVEGFSSNGNLMEKFLGKIFGYNAEVTFESSDDTSGLNGFNYEIKYEGKEEAEYGYVKVDEGKNSATVKFEQPEGEFEIKNVTAVDNAGNRSEHRENDGRIVIIDQTSPNIQVDYPSTEHRIQGQTEDEKDTLYYGVSDLNKIAEEGSPSSGEDTVTLPITFKYKEENFFSSLINKTDGNGGYIDNGCSIKVAANGSKPEYIAPENLAVDEGNQTITYNMNIDMADHSSDGEYVFYYSYRDPAGNDTGELIGNTVVIDTTAPVVTVTENLEAANTINEDSQEKTYFTDSEGYIYYTGGEENVPLEFSYAVTDKNMNASCFDVKGTASAYVSEEDAPEFNTTFSGFNAGSGVYKNSLKFTGEARYEYTAYITDLAGNEAVMASEDDQQTEPVNISEITNKLVYDNSDPEVNVEYEEPSIAERVLQGVTFGIYKADSTVTVTAVDTVSDIYSLSYEAYVQDGASAANEGVDVTTIIYGDENFNAAVKDNNGNVEVSFDISPQFRGFVKADAITFGQLETLYDGSADEHPTGIIVDAKKPEGSLAINEPYIVLNSQNEVVDYKESGIELNEFVNSENSNDCRFIYTDPAVITIYITEDNFNLSTEADGSIVASVENDSVDGETNVSVGTTVTVNGEVLNNLKWEKTDVVGTDNSDVFKTTVTLDQEGYYVLEVNSVDVAGNQMQPIKKAFSIDNTAPEITNFKISTEGDYYYKDELITDGSSQEEEIDAQNPSQSSSLEETFGNNRYDYYFTTQTKLEVTAKDLFIGDSESNAVNSQESGVREIILLVQDFETDDNNSVTVTWKVYRSDPSTTTTTNHSDLTSTFTIDGPFKGNVFAIPVDRCGHFPYKEATETALAKFNWVTEDDYKDDIQYVLDFEHLVNDPDTQRVLKEAGLSNGAGFVAPYDVIIENNDKHQKHSSIVITYDEQVVETERNRDRYIDESRITSVVGDAALDATPQFINTVETAVPLFRSNIDVTVNVSDYYSGIRNVELYVLGREGQDTEHNYQETLKIDNNAVLSEDGWTVVNRADNLVYEVQKTITVSNDSNDIIILAVLTDRSGNRSYDYNVIGIDKTAPKITLTYSDSNVRTGNYDEFYNHRRTATITVDERNFDTSYITAALNNTDKTYTYAPNISNITQESAWRSNNDPNNPVYTYVIDYTSNGTFDFRMNLKDAAGNASNVVSSRFTIDLIRPYIAVSLDSNDVVQNGKYFNRTRTATIVVTEHNFNQREFENHLRATLNGRNITVPSVSSFVNTGNDTWRATVVFSSDGDYVLDFSYTDKAGNRYETAANDYSGAAARDFTIDKTAPVINIDVNDRYAYIEGPIVSITERDNNCSDITTNMSGTVYDNGFRTIDIHSTETTMRQDHHNADFVVRYDKITQDGYYSVEASCVDMAGNRSNTVSKVFTKNEFGAVYSLSEDLQAAVNDAYVNKDKYFAGKSGNIYIDEFSPVPISAEESDFYININSKRQEDCVSRTEISTVDGWYLYRYVLDNNKLSAEGLYTIYIRSTANMDSGSVTNNAQNASDEHRLDIGFTIDNTNPYVKIGGLQDHINNRTTQKDITLTVSDNNLYKIKAIIEKEDQTTTYVWVNNPDKYEKEDPTEIVDTFIDESSQDSSLVEVGFPLTLISGESSAQYNIRLEISDLAGNYAKNADDYNKDELFTDAYGRLNYLFDANSEGADSVMNYLELSDITLSKNFAIGQMIRDNQPIAIAIFAAIALVILLIIIVPIIVKRRKKLDDQDAKKVE